MRILSLLASLPLLAIAQVILPDNAIQGMALHVQDETGNMTYIHESEFEKYNISLVTGGGDGTNSTNSTSLETRGSGDYMVCDTPVIDIEDLRTGLILLTDQLGCDTLIQLQGGAPFKFVALTLYYGSTVVYICNYLEALLHFTGPTLFQHVTEAFSHCGQTNTAAWYHGANLDLSWGYTNAANEFCGPRQ
ncbi:hypothetical protein NQ176_g10463 [Zarea fungicola]|uniref:Uncharacterized protein n=1 Tax=Zarea fungicola TaxID=93591 RepID=A0ACC1MGA0_9HYPO|nr:hypothetical protein NQ176_g10463 [Lecanicillium fungicola]